jgi:prepilin-type processing-associated H-X9-DG protein
LVEILVVITVIAILMALLFPAVQSSREAGRRVTCQNHLHQLGLGVQGHLSAMGYYPTGGWGFRWVGDPDRGYAERQPGGWVYNILAYVEEGELRRHGAGASLDLKKLAATEVTQHPVAIFNCPTRRRCNAYPYQDIYPPKNADSVPLVAKSDYAINGGDIDCGNGQGPETLEEGDGPSFSWADFSDATGISYLRSRVFAAEVRDGTSCTYCVGEKYRSQQSFDRGDDQSMYAGYDYDATRWTSLGLVPLRDDWEWELDRFGSAHPGVCNFVMLDGSVRAISYEIDAEIHRRLGSRKDGQVVDIEQL